MAHLPCPHSRREAKNILLDIERMILTPIHTLRIKATAENRGGGKEGR